MARPIEVLAIIPARAGSKGIPNKNLVRLGGKPLIVRTVQAARACREIGRVVVTTDSPEIAAAARRAGAETPFLRPKSLADDATPVIRAAAHALRWLEQRQSYRPDIVALLQPTSPFRTAGHLSEAISLFLRLRADTVVGVRKPDVHPFQCVAFREGRMRFMVKRPARRLNRQEYPQAWALNGAIFLASAELLRKGDLYGSRVFPYPMDRRASLDVNTPEDLDLARYYLQGGRRQCLN